MKEKAGSALPEAPKAVIDQRIRDALPIAEAVARRMSHKLGNVIAADELHAIAQPVLLEAVKSYDPNRSPFGPYLVMKLKWAMLEEARKLYRRREISGRVVSTMAMELVAEAEEPPANPSEPTTEAEDRAALAQFLAKRAAALSVGLISVAHKPHQEKSQESPEELFAREELRNIVHAAVRELPDKQRQLIDRHYFGGEKFETIAADLGVSKSWASRLHAQAMETLAQSVRERL